MIKEECSKRLNREIVNKDEEEEILNDLTIATIKYADLLPYRTSDYIFDIEKFCDLEGKTGSYLLYSTVRIKSLLRKAQIENISTLNYSKINNEQDRNIIITLLKLSNIIQKTYESKSFNELAEYTYKLVSAFNTFYADSKIMIEEDEEQKLSWLVLSKTVLDTILMLLNIMGIKCPEKM